MANGRAIDIEQLQALTDLLHLGRRVREARDAMELGYIAMNETHRLAPYRQAVLWIDKRVTALSGVVTPDANVPYIQWLNRMVTALPKGQKTMPCRIEPESLNEDVREEWDEWLPLHALWLPLPVIGNHFPGGGLLLARDEAWQEQEISLLNEWADIWVRAWALMNKPGVGEYAHQLRTSLYAALPTRGDARALAWVLRHPAQWYPALKAAWVRPRNRWLLVIILAAIFPVRLSVLAPGELVPAHPAVVRAPLDGVIERILIQPNQIVKAGDKLFEFDRTTLASKLIVAVQSLASAEAEYRQHAQQALFDDKSKGLMAVALGRLEEKKSEVAYLGELNQRAVVTAPSAGRVLFDDPSEWVGRPVSTGEKVMMIATDDDVEIEAWLSPADVIDLQAGSPATLYLNTRPFSPLTGKVRYVSFEAQQRPDSQYAYRLRAALPKDAERGRAGLKGTAKVTGGWVPAVYWVLRKPLAVLRNFIGL